MGALFVFNLTSGIVAARALGPEGRGILAAAISWPLLVSGLLHMSNGDTVAYFVARRREKSRSLRSSKISSISIRFALFSSFTGSALLIILVNFYLDLDKRVENLIVNFMFLQIFCNHMMLICLGYFQGNSNFLHWNIAKVSLDFFYAVSCLLLLYSSIRNPSIFAAAMLMSAGLAMMIGLFLSRSFFWANSTIRVGDLKNFLNYSLKLHAGRSITIVRVHADKAALTIFAPLDEVGFYVAASAIAFVMVVLGMTLSSIVQPICTRMFVSNNLSLRKEYILLTSFSVIIVVCFGIFISLLAPHIVLLAFGERFEQAISLVGPLIMAAVLAALSRLMGVLFLSSGRLRYIIGGEFAWVVAFSAGVLYLKPDTGREMAQLIFGAGILLFLVTLLPFVILVNRHIRPGITSGNTDSL